MLEKNNKIVVIESPAFYENNIELEKYINSLNVKLDGILLSYHMGGGTFLKNAKKYATHNAKEYGHIGGGKALIDNFTKIFGESFDSHIHNITDYIEKGKITLADIEMNIITTNEGYDIEIPEINSIYTHMLGSDCHSIVAGVEHAKEMIEKVKNEYPKYSSINYLEMTANFFFPEN